MTQETNQTSNETNQNTKNSWNNHWGNQSTVKRLQKASTAYPEVTKVLLGITDENSKCIELGCGSGTYAIELLINKRNCIASDFSESALELVKIKGGKLYNINVPTQLIDIYNIPYPDNTFDLIFSDGLIEHLDIPRALKETKRSLKTAGWMVAKIPSGSLLYKMVFYLLSPFENRPYEAWFSKKEWQKKLLDCGYKNVSIYDCGGVVKGFFMRIKGINKLLKYLPNFGKIYFLIKAQK